MMLNCGRSFLGLKFDRKNPEFWVKLRFNINCSEKTSLNGCGNCMFKLDRLCAKPLGCQARFVITGFTTEVGIVKLLGLILCATWLKHGHKTSVIQDICDQLLPFYISDVSCIPMESNPSSILKLTRFIENFNLGSFW